MPGKKDALTDLAQNLQNLNSGAQNQPKPTNQNSPNKPYQVVNDQGQVINLGYKKQ